MHLKGFTCHLIYERVASPCFFDWTLCTVQLRMGQEVQIFIFARFVHLVSCSKVADCFVHAKREAQSSRVVCLWFIFWATKGFWFSVSWGSWPSVDFMCVFLCFIFLSRYYFSDVLLFFWLGRNIDFYTGSKNPKKSVYLCRADIVPVLLKWDYFVLLAESLPVFLVAYNALEVLGHTWNMVVHGVTGSSACS